MGHCNVVLPLPLGEGHPGDRVLLGEAFDACYEHPGHGGHELRTGKGLAAMKAKESRRPTVMLQARLVDVQEHAVDTLDLQGHVIPDDIGNGLGYTHQRAPTTASRPPTAKRFNKLGTSFPV